MDLAMFGVTCIVLGASAEDVNDDVEGSASATSFKRQVTF